MPQEHYQPLSCMQCANASALGFDFSFAFQPIVRASTREVISYEALARGLQGEPFAHVYQNVTAENLYRFDQACRVKAIKLAAELGMKETLSINFSPNAVYRPELCIRTTLAAAEEYNFPLDRISFEVTEGEEVQEKSHLVNIIREYQSMGFTTAIDDFGAGYSGLNLLAEFQPDYIKIDRNLIDGVDQNPARQAIIEGIMLTCSKLSIGVLAEGVERHEEYVWLRQHGVDLFQGYYFARPGFQCLPSVARELFDI
ncbi:MAG: diguanylate phosphodiesterase [Gammaproteobacteria bacterium RIFCSPLOWO2_02_FULL_57_10]|nr:MAG: diguanylate phosphodiesterase [Gammaproteobacteria bacterium RIFCSPLOWO2_02_FULL_57_10]